MSSQETTHASSIPSRRAPHDGILPRSHSIQSRNRLQIRFFQTKQLRVSQRFFIGTTPTRFATEIRFFLPSTRSLEDSSTPDASSPFASPVELSVERDDSLKAPIFSRRLFRSVFVAFDRVF